MIHSLTPYIVNQTFFDAIYVVSVITLHRCFDVTRRGGAPARGLRAAAAPRPKTYPTKAPTRTCREAHLRC